MQTQFAGGGGKKKTLAAVFSLMVIGGRVDQSYSVIEPLPDYAVGFYGILTLFGEGVIWERLISCVQM